MSVEDTFAALLDERLRPLRTDLETLTGEVSRLRACLPPMPGYLPDVARTLGCSVSTAKRMAKRGELPRLPGGGRARYDLSQLRPMSTDDVAREARRLRSAL